MPLTFLMEVGFWGLPSECSTLDPRSLHASLCDLFARDQFGVARLRIWLSSTRIALLAEGIPESQSEKQIEVRGPKASVAFDFNLVPTPAAMGFASAQGVEVGDLTIRDVDGEKFVFARKKDRGSGFWENLPQLLPRILKSIPWGLPPWGTGMYLPQPPSYAVVLVDERMPSLAIDGVTISRESGIRENNGFKRISVSHALEFPRIMQNAGISPLPADRVKLIESQFQTVVPQGTSVRRSSCSLAKAAFDFERPRVFSTSFPEKDVSIPMALLGFELSNRPNWFALQKDDGTYAGTLVGILENRMPVVAESDLRCKALRRRLQQLFMAWENDQAKPLRERVNDLRLVSAGVGQGSRYDEAVRISRRSKALAGLLQIPEPEGAIDQVSFFAFCGPTLSLGKFLPNNTFSIAALLAASQNLAVEVLEPLQDLGQCGLGGETQPATTLGGLIAASWLLDQILTVSEPALSEKERWGSDFFRILLAKKWNLDLLALVPEPNDASVSRDFWEKLLSVFLLSYGYSAEKHGRLLKSQHLDPLGLVEAIKAWPDGVGKELDGVVSLYRKVVSRCGNRGQSLGMVNPANAQEESLKSKLEEAEKVSPGRLKALSDVLWSARAEVEACLMDLPPILEDSNQNLNSRLVLLARFCRIAGLITVSPVPEPGRSESQKNDER